MSDAKAFPFPVLSPHSLDYKEGVGYESKVNRDQNKDAVHVQHNLKGDSIIACQVRDQRAVFACVVSLPSTMYRRLFVSDSHNLSHVQQIDFSESGYDGDVSPMFRPLILSKAGLEKTVAKEDGLGDFWLNETIRIPAGGIIAFDDWQRFGGNMGGILLIEADPKLGDGEMRVEADATGGFRFRVHVGLKLLHDLEDLPENHPHRRSVLIHALSAGFGILQRDYKSDWEEHVNLNLNLIAKKLEQEGIEHWSSDGFSPEYAATRLYPHVVSTQTNEEDDED